MTFQKAQESGYLIAEKEVQKIAKQVYRQYKIAEKSIINELAKLYGKMSSLKPDQYYDFAIKFNRLKILLQEVRKNYTFHAKKAGNLIAKAGTVGFSENYFRQQFVLTWFSPNVNVNLKFTMLNDNLVNYAVTGLPEYWKKIPKRFIKEFYTPKYGTLSDILVKNKVLEINKIYTAITQQLILGKSYLNTARKVKGIFGQSIYNATRVIRTESTRLLNQGSYTNSINALQQNVPLQKEWLSTLDSRTRTSHGVLDNKRINIKEFFKLNGDKGLYPGDFSQIKNNINCRCAYIDVIKGMSLQVRRGKNPVTGDTEVFTWKNYNDWKKEKVK